MQRREVRAQFDEIVAFAQLEQFIDTPVKRYSSGMFMRLAFAVAAHLDPEIMLIDEVLAVGDAAFQKKCLGKMGKVAKEGKTILFVSHNMVAIKSLCPRAIWLDEGRVRDIGDSSHVVASYLHSYATHETAQVWEDVETAPGNDVFRLHQVGVRAENGSRLDMVTMQTPFTLDVEFWTLMPGINLHISLQFMTEEHMVAFCTSASDEPGIATRSLPSGLFRCSCRIPANLLNSGQYKINLLVVRDMHGVVYEYEDLLSLEIMDLQKRSEGWFGRTTGAVCPLLNWTMECISE
jgi:lipopolysaccharide transport system ATP-binding protein